MKLVHGINKLIIGGCLAIILSNSAYTQSNHSYPRIGVFHFASGSTPAEWHAKFDLIITSSNSSGFASAIKAINPDAIVLPTKDWNAGAGINNYNLPDEWKTQDSNGDYVTIYGGMKNLIDITDYCYTSSSYGDKKYNEYLAEYYEDYADYNYFDGFSSDGTWIKPHDTNDIDLDKNGSNDYSEHGSSWIENQWQAGILTAVTDVRATLGEDKVIVFNPGAMKLYDSQNNIVKKINGIIAEHHKYMDSYYNFKRAYTTYSQHAVEPHVTLIDGEGNSKTDFSWMRFWVGLTSLGDGYASFSDRPGTHEHHYDHYYDEYDLNLGMPTSGSYQLYSTGTNDQGVYVRFFSDGAVIVNIDESNRTVSDDEIQVYDEYDGPYYRFKGGQVPTVNNGEVFQSVNLVGVDNGYYWRGDAIFLVTSPQTVISDIYVDSDDEGTSPGSYPAEYTGSWTQTNDDISNAWALSYRGYRDAWAVAYSAAGDGSSSAVFKPTIGVGGFYKVYEWHGDVRYISEGSDVPYEIRHANGNSRGIINQRENYGRWNYLGTFYFNSGNEGYVKLNNQANGIVVADAFKFVFDENGEVDNTPPNAPVNLGCESKTENSITLSWSPPQQASDGDIASSYEIHRDNNFIGYTVYTNYLDSNLDENTSYSYDIYSVDDYGNISTTSAYGDFWTSIDEVAPGMDSVYALTNSIVKIIFSESLDQSSAENINNYTINNEISILSASLMSDEKTVNLNTDKHEVGVTYTLTMNNIKDKASTPNYIEANTTVQYIGVGDPIEISLSADNGYELYINGEYMGSDGTWENAETYYYISRQVEKNVIAIKCNNNDMTAGIVAEIAVGEDKYVSNETWKVTTSYQEGWETLAFNDNLWSNATSYGLHGTADPWAQYGNVDGISHDSGVAWIWSSNNEVDSEVYLRFIIGNNNADLTPPAPPTGVSVVRP